MPFKPKHEKGSPVGLRRTSADFEKISLDEIPQFLNILMRQMSIIGPRPDTAGQLEKYKQEEQLPNLAMTLSKICFDL